MSYFPSMGGYFVPTDRRDDARKARQEFEGTWAWNPSMEGFSDELKRVEQFGVDIPKPFEAVPVRDAVSYEPVPAPDAVGYGVQTWSPMISTSYPGLFWNPSTGRMETQAQIMSKLKWPTMGGIPYQYNPPRPRGFMGIEYPLHAPPVYNEKAGACTISPDSIPRVSQDKCKQCGWYWYNGHCNQNKQFNSWSMLLFGGIVLGFVGLGIGSWYLKKKQQAKQVGFVTRLLGLSK